MKKKFSTILSVLLVVIVTTTTAQESTTYRGAFAPAPTAMWTDNWANWDPQNTFYPTPNVNVSGVISTNTTWTKNNTYKLSGLVFVDTLVTLTIEPGTVIRGDETVANSALVIQRGGKLIANGTSCNPIVFTSNKAAGTRGVGNWGGIIMLGRAIHNAGTQNLIEGIDPSNLRAYHGGTNDADNSGILKYVRIEYGGYVFAANSEINGLTMGSVGSGTTINYVQTSFINDDGFEWFGGTVNCSHLVSYRNLDDDFDTDNGFSGTVQYALGVKDPAISDNPAVSTSEGFESDNNAGGTTAAPKTKAKFYNVTQIGAFRCGSNGGTVSQPSANGFLRGLRLRRNTELKIYNSIFMNNFRGLIIDGVTLATNQMVFQNNIIAMDTTQVFVAPYAGTARINEDAATNNYMNALALTNNRIATPCDLLTNAWDFLNPDYRPNSTGGSSGGSVSGTDLTPLIEIDNALFPANQTSELNIDLLENNFGNTNGVITITIPVLSGWDLKVPGSSPGTFLILSSTPQTGFNGTNTVSGGTNYTNGDWMFSLVGPNIIITSKAGVGITVGNFVQLGFVATRKAGTPNGTNQNLSVNVNGGGDNNATNNGQVTAFAAN